MVVFIFLVTLKISLGTKNADCFRDATGVGDSEPLFDSETDMNLMKKGLTDPKCTDTREWLEDILNMDPIKLLKFNKKFPLKSQGRLLEEDFIKNETRAGDMYSQYKLEKLYQKALRGQDINVVVIAGSNAAGEGFEQDEKSVDRIFYNVVAKWWNATFGEWTGSHMRIHSVVILWPGKLCICLLLRQFLTHRTGH